MPCHTKRRVTLHAMPHKASRHASCHATQSVGWWPAVWGVHLSVRVHGLDQKLGESRKLAKGVVWQQWVYLTTQLIYQTGRVTAVGVSHNTVDLPNGACDSSGCISQHRWFTKRGVWQQWVYLTTQLIYQTGRLTAVGISHNTADLPNGPSDSSGCISQHSWFTKRAVWQQWVYLTTQLIYQTGSLEVWGQR